LFALVQTEIPFLRTALGESHFQVQLSCFFRAAWRPWTRLSPSNGLVR